jgi:hypothetical protein
MSLYARVNAFNLMEPVEGRLALGVLEDAVRRAMDGQARNPGGGLASRAANGYPPS